MQFSVLSALSEIAGTVGQTNAGGFSRVRLAAASQLLIDIPDRFPPIAQSGYTTHNISGQVLTFTETAVIVDIEALPEHISFVETSEPSGNGIIYKPTVQIVLPKVRPEVVAWVDAYAGTRFVAFLQDRNGFFRMAGLPDQPLILAPIFGQELGKGRNQSVLIFSGQTERPAFFLDGIEDADLVNVGPFSDEFGFSFDT